MLEEIVEYFVTVNGIELMIIDGDTCIPSSDLFYRDYYNGLVGESVDFDPWSRYDRKLILRDGIVTDII